MADREARVVVDSNAVRERRRERRFEVMVVSLAVLVH